VTEHGVAGRQRYLPPFQVAVDSGIVPVAERVDQPLAGINAVKPSHPFSTVEAVVQLLAGCHPIHAGESAGLIADFAGLGGGAGDGDLAVESVDAVTQQLGQIGIGQSVDDELVAALEVGEVALLELKTGNEVEEVASDVGEVLAAQVEYGNGILATGDADQD
jgi:hypothetical protein